jgi:hypothetical protein
MLNNSAKPGICFFFWKSLDHGKHLFMDQTFMSKIHFTSDLPNHNPFAGQCDVMAAGVPVSLMTIGGECRGAEASTASNLHVFHYGARQ